jgi:hypothetical protein
MGIWTVLSCDAWLPGLFGDADLMNVRGSEVLHVTRFTAANEDLVKDFTLKTLLDPKAYGRMAVPQCQKQ